MLLSYPIFIRSLILSYFYHIMRTKRRYSFNDSNNFFSLNEKLPYILRIPFVWFCLKEEKKTELKIFIFACEFLLLKVIL